MRHVELVNRCSQKPLSAEAMCVCIYALVFALSASHTHTHTCRTEAGRKSGVPEGLLMAEVMAYLGRYQDAARLYTQNGESRSRSCWL